MIYQSVLINVIHLVIYYSAVLRFSITPQGGGDSNMKEAGMLSYLSGVSFHYLIPFRMFNEKLTKML